MLRCEQCTTVVPARFLERNDEGALLCPDCVASAPAGEQAAATETPWTPVPPAPAVATARETRRARSEPAAEPSAPGGSETSLDNWGTIFKVLGWLNALVAMLGVWRLAAEGADGVAWVMAGLLGAMSSVFFATLLRGAADVVRLLKRLNGLPYEGDI